MRDGDFELVTLRNGARAVRDAVSGEIMHPAVGPWEEAQRLYVTQLRLVDRLAEADARPLRVLDVGLGAATNAVAALTAARTVAPERRRPLEVVSLERDLAPLRLALADSEGFPFLVPFAEAAATLVERGIWAGEGTDAGITWRLVHADVEQELEAAGTGHDCVFFDPFSPRANPTLWTPTFLSRVRALCRADGDGAVLATYSAATPTRVSLLLAGFHVGVGCSTGSKQETTVAATVPEALESPLSQRWLERWERSSARAPHGEALSAELEARIRSHPQFRHLG